PDLSLRAIERGDEFVPGRYVPRGQVGEFVAVQVIVIGRHGILLNGCFLLSRLFGSTELFLLVLAPAPAPAGPALVAFRSARVSSGRRGSGRCGVRFPGVVRRY